MLALDPTNADGHANLGNAYRAKSMNDQALAEYGTSISQCGKSPYPYEGRALVYLATNQVDLAIADLSEAIALKPDYTAALTNRGNAYAAQGKYDLAIADFNTELKYKPADTVAIANRAAVYAKMGKPDLAAGDLTAAASKANPDNPAPYRALGNSYMSQKNFAQAIGQYDIASEARSARCDHAAQSRRLLSQPRQVREGDRGLQRGAQIRAQRRAALQQPRQRLWRDPQARRSDRRLQEGAEHPARLRRRPAQS